MQEHRYLRMTLYGVIGVVLLLVFYGIYLNTASIAHIQKIIDAKTLKVTVSQAKMRDIGDVIENVDMQVKATWKTDLLAQVDGTIEKVYVNAGDHVKKGDPLIKLTNHEIYAQLAASSAQIEEVRVNLLNAENKVKRYNELRKYGAISGIDHDNAIAVRDAAIAQLKNVEAQRDRILAQADNMMVYAPTDAVVLSVYRNVGYYARSSNPLLMLAESNEFTASTIIPQREIDHFVIHNRRYILEIPPHLFAYKAYKLKSESRSVELNSNQFYVTLTNIDPKPTEFVPFYDLTWSIENNRGMLEPIIYRDCKLYATDHNRVLSIPTDAVFEYGDAHYVFCIDENDTLYKKTISIGIQDSKYTEVRMGLGEGEFVVCNNHRSLDEGLKVNMKDRANDE